MLRYGNAFGVESVQWGGGRRVPPARLSSDSLPPPPPVVIRSPCQDNDPADAHTSAHKSVLESANPRMDSECIWMHLVNGMGNSPVSGTADPWSSQTGQVIRGLR